MIVGCFTLDLYCDVDDCCNPDKGFRLVPSQFTGESRAECYAKARQAGWIIHRNYTASCPPCAKRHKKY